MPLYRQRHTHTAVVPATLAEVWEYVESREAQVRYDERLHRIDVIEGRWGEPGCRMATTATLPSGQTHTWEHELVAVEPRASYTTRTPFPDGVTTGTHRFEEVEGGTAWTQTIETVTRRLSVLEYLVLVSSARQRRAEAARDHDLDLQALSAALHSMRER